MKNLRSKFNSAQLAVFQKAGIDPKDDTEYSDDELVDMEDAISDYFQLHGLGDHDSVNSTGRICESIMDIFAEFE